ncbi:MAG: response regulator [Bacteroidales bacterium]|nr:response regulator [Bacteroidales bacterium]
MRKFRFEYRFTAIYVLLGFLWILFSDSILGSLIHDHDLLTRTQTYKGWLYVTVTAVLFFTILRKHLIKLRNAEKRAVESDQLKTAFLQNVSHELRTPMNGIIGFASLLDDNDLQEEQKKEYISIITQSTYRLLDLVNQILDISLIETGSSLVLKQPAYLNKLMAEIQEIWSPKISKEVTFSFSQGLNSPEDCIYTDEYKLKQILNNLISNAVKFTSIGHICVGYSLKGNILEFYVEDTGLGIPPENHTDIFKPFRKSEPESNRFYDGVGVGLAICKGNLDLLNGKIHIHSEPGTGSIFRFTIPYEPVRLKGSPIKPTENFSSFNGLLILVVEDETLNVSYIEEILEGTGIEIHHAPNGQVAVELCKNNSNYNLVLMDIRMPVMNGYEATRLIKELRPGLPVIAQTAYIAGEERHKALEVGFDAFLSKPYLKEELLEAIAKQLSKNPVKLDQPE